MMITRRPYHHRALRPESAARRIIASLLALLMVVLSPAYGFCAGDTDCESSEAPAHDASIDHHVDASTDGESVGNAIDPHDGTDDHDGADPHHCSPDCWCCGAHFAETFRYALSEEPVLHRTEYRPLHEELRFAPHAPPTHPPRFSVPHAG